MEVKTTGTGWCIAFICQTCSLCPASAAPSPELSCLSSHTLLLWLLLLLLLSSSVSSLQNGVVHRDLKLENILLDDNCNIKVKLSRGVGMAGGRGSS
jgi:serine/threonine protein kinase